MPSRSEAYSSYLKDIHTQYDVLLGDAGAKSAASQVSLSVAASDFVALDAEANGDIMELAFIVMMEATKSAQEDLKAIMDEVKAARQVKERLGERIAKLKRSVDGEADAHQADNGARLKWAAHRFDQVVDCERLDADLAIQLLLMLAARQSDRTVEALASEYLARREHLRIAKAASDQRANLDELDEISELEQLRLQIILDRRQKFLEALSNILKKMAETQDAIIQNLK